MYPQFFRGECILTEIPQQKEEVVKRVTPFKGGWNQTTARIPMIMITVAPNRIFVVILLVSGCCALTPARISQDLFVPCTDGRISE